MIEERFRTEALVTARLQHPSIVPIYDVGQWPTGESFYCMRLVSGRSLGEVIAETQTSGSGWRSCRTCSRWQKPWRMPTASTSFIAT